MVLEVDLYLKRAEEKILLAKTCFGIPTTSETKKFLNLSQDKTFFNDVISLSYYSIFYAAKAYLLSKGIETWPPEEHKKTYQEFAKFVEMGVLSRELLNIYEDAALKAESLLEIFLLEKRKRGRFTYNINSDANLPFANDSVENAKKFVSAVIAIVKEQ